MDEDAQPRIVAIVPMRHFSRRVAGKNYRVLGDRPLHRHILDTLLSVPRIAEVIVDTDSPQISSEVEQQLPQVHIVQRPEHLRSEMITMNDILINTIRHVDADYYLQTHSTNPLLREETISRAIELFLAKRDQHDSLFSVTPLQTRLWSADGRALNHDPDNLIRTQDLEPIMEENSCMYLFSRDVLEKRHNRIGQRPLTFAMDPAEALDIDTEVDWEVARARLAVADELPL